MSGRWERRSTPHTAATATESSLPGSSCSLQVIASYQQDDSFKGQYSILRGVFYNCLTEYKQARKLQATLDRNYDPATDALTGVRCSVANKTIKDGGVALQN